MTSRWLCFEWVLPKTGKLHKRGLNFLFCILLIDIVSSILLFFTTHDWWFVNSNESFTSQDFNNDFTHFHHGTSDLMLLIIIRILVLYIFITLAVNKGVPRELWPDETVPSMIPFYDKFHKKRKKPYIKKTNKMKMKIKKNKNTDSNDKNINLTRIASNEDVNVDLENGTGSKIIFSSGSNSGSSNKTPNDTSNNGKSLSKIENNGNTNSKGVAKSMLLSESSSMAPTPANETKENGEINEDESSENGENNELLGDSGSGGPINFESKEHEEDYEKRKHKHAIIKNAILLSLFLLFTGFQGYVGVKCVTFEFNGEKNVIEGFQGFFYGLIVLCINLEIFFAKTIVDKASDLGDGILLPKLHAHPLYLEKKLKFWCNLCRSRIKFYGYRCPDCSFDVCSSCYKKHVKMLQEKENEKKQQKSLTNVSKKSDKLSKNGNNKVDMSKGGNFKFNVYDGATGKDNKNVASIEKSHTQEELSNRKYIMRAAKLCKPHLKILILAFVCLAINSGSNLLLPSSQGAILDKIVDLNKSGFYEQVRIYLVLSVLTGFFGAIRNLCFTVVGRKISVSVRSTMFRSMMVQDIAFFDGMSTGELTSRMTSDVNGMVSPLRTMLQSALSNTISLIGGLVACFVTSWRLSMLAFTTVAPVIFLTGQYAKWSRGLNRQIWAAYGTASSVAVQAFSNIRTVRSFGMEYKEMRLYDKQLQQVLQKGILDSIASTATFALTNYLDLGAGVLILWFGGLTIFNIESGRIDNSDLTIGKLITFQLYWNMINTSYKGLQNIITAFTRAGGAAQRVLTLLDNLPDIDLNSGIECRNLDGYIHIDNVHFTYPMRPDQPVLKGINLNIEPGQVIALVGKSGGGKSTLCHLLMRFYDPTEGNIYYNGGGNRKINLRNVNLTQFRKQIGIVSQETQLFDFTIEENITYGLDDTDGDFYTKEELHHVSKLANCHEFIMSFEDGYQTRVGERGVRLSGGQKQRIAIARMLMRKPKVLILDEATSSLDTQSEALVQAAIDKSIWHDENDNESDNKVNHHSACAVILVAHRLSTVINADKIAVIDKGQIVELGNHEELLKIENGVYHRLVSRQIQREANKLNQDSKDDDDGDGNGSGDSSQEKADNGFKRRGKGNGRGRGRGNKRGAGGRGRKGSTSKTTAIDSIDSLFDDVEKENEKKKDDDKENNNDKNESGNKSTDDR